MNFQTLQRIEKPAFYIDLAFRSAKKEGSLERERVRGNKFEVAKNVERKKFRVIKSILYSSLNHVLKSYPSIDQLPEFYVELIKTTLDYASLKKSLGAMNWGRKKIDDFYKFYDKKLQMSADMTGLTRLKNEYYGRIASVVKQIKNELAYLEQARRIMKRYPSVKTNMKTIAIAGFPNVGKTTLLYKLTGSKPEIKSYAFTTKDFNLGYMKKDDEKIQLIDTPGTLNRHNRMNEIEKLGELAIKHLAKKIIYVVDLTGSYPLNDQILLLNELRARKLDIVVYYSKCDILDNNRKKTLEIYKKKFGGFNTPEEVIQII